MKNKLNKLPRVRIKFGTVFWCLFLVIIIYFTIAFTLDNNPQKLSQKESIFTSKTKPLQKINDEFLHRPLGNERPHKSNDVANMEGNIDDTFEVISVRAEPATRKPENGDKAKDKVKQNDGNAKRKKGPEVRHVAFLKVHKTASSTTQNVFLRFGDGRNLSFVLAHTHGESGWLNVISYNNTITSMNIVPHPTDGRFDILCNHVLYDRASFERVLHKDTVYIGIVREPISRFQSAMKFFSPGFILKIPGDTPLLTYSQEPLKYEPKDPRKSQTNNRMAVEFGFPSNLFPGQPKSESKLEVDKYLEKVDKEWKLIIISERYDESMIMMKRYLNWGAKDVLYMEQNVAMAATNPRKIVPEAAKDNLRKFLHLDVALYKFAVDRFEKQVKAEGADFADEVKAFKTLRKDVKDFCSSKKDQLVVPANKWDDKFTLTKKDCSLYHRHEKDLIQKQRMRMYGTYDN